MKPGLAILPLEVWADVFEHPSITRQIMAQIADNNGDRQFTEKLQKLLHECDKHGLHYLKISYKTKDNSKNQLNPEYQASLAVAPYAGEFYKNSEFPENDDEMPENIKKFKQLSIGYLDDQVLDFLAKIKPLFTDVFLNIEAIESVKLRILLGHLLPMCPNIRGIRYNGDWCTSLEPHFPGTMALAKELDVWARPAYITAYLKWLSTPHNFDADGPKFLKMRTSSIPEFVKAVRKQFLTETTQLTFVIYLEDTFPISSSAEEFQLENVTTHERLAVRNAIFKKSEYYLSRDVHYVEILRHPIGEEAKTREWVKKRAYYEQKYNNDENGTPHCEAEQLISIAGSLTIGKITKKKEAKAMDQDKGRPADKEDDAEPSISASK